MSTTQRLPLGALPIAAPTLTAQQAADTLSAWTPVAAMTSAAAGPTTLDGIPQSATIGGYPDSVFPGTSQSPANAYLGAATICYPAMSYQGRAGFTFFERACARGTVSDVAGSSASADQAGATLGAHDVLATFAAPPGIPA